MVKKVVIGGYAHRCWPEGPASGMARAAAPPAAFRKHGGPRRGEAKHPGCQATSREGVRTQRAGTGSDDGRHSRLISP